MARSDSKVGVIEQFPNEQRDNIQDCITVYSKDIYSTSYIFNALKPMFFIMKFVGLFHNKTISMDKQTAAKFKLTASTYKGITKSQVWSSIMLILIWIIALTRLSNFTRDIQFDVWIIFTILTTVWYMQIAIAVTTWYFGCYTFGALPSFILLWDELYRNNKTPQNHLKLIRKRGIISVIICVIVVLTNLVTFGYVLITTEINDSVIAPINPKSEYAIVAQIIILVLMMFISFHWSLPIVAIVNFGLIISDTFKHLNEDMTKHFNSDSFINYIEDIRLQHNDIAKLVKHLDVFLCIYLAGTFVQNICAMMFVLYSLIWYHDIMDGPFILATCLFWFIVNTVALCLHFWPTVIVNNQVCFKDLKSFSFKCFIQCMYLSNVYAIK